MPLISDVALDLALDYINDQATILHICTTEPTVYGTLNSCGTKTPPVISDTPENGTSGRKVVVSAIEDGSVICTGTVTADSWALVSGTALLAAGQLSASQSVTNGNTFTLASFDIQISDAT